MSEYIKSKNVKYKAFCAVYAFIAAIAAGMPLTANAKTTRNWIGGTGTADEPMNLWDYANWDGEGDFGTGNTVDCFLSVTDTTYLDSKNTYRFCCDLVPNAGDFVFTGPLQFYSFKPGSVENSTVSIVKKSGDWQVVTYGMYIGNASGATATFVNESGNITSTSTSYGVHLGCVAGATGIVENVSGDWTIEGDIYLAQTSDTAATFVNEAGNVTVNNVNFGTYAKGGGTGTLTVKGGTVTVNKDARFYGGEGTINLDGGTLKTRLIKRYGSNGSYVQHINFNGGTLKATADGALIHSEYGYLRITVNAGGGIIDCNGYAVTLNQGPEGRYNDFAGAGGLIFTGGNTITIKRIVSYSGTTSVTPGTTLVVENEDAKNNILSHGLVVAGIPTEGQTVFSCTSALDDADLTKVSCPLAPATTFVFGDEGKTNIVVGVVGPEIGVNYWTGKAGDNNLSTAGNWSDNTVPSGNSFIFSAGPATLTKGDSFAPASITFFEGSAPVTINGDFTSLTKVTNNSSVNQTFAGFVDFGDGDIDVTATAALAGDVPNQTVAGGCVVFKGGVKGVKVVNHSIVAGNYTLTADEAFATSNTGVDRFTINENSSLSVKNANVTYPLYIREGATFNVENYTRTSGGTWQEGNCLWSWSKGAFVVANFTYDHGGSGGCWLGGHTFSSSYGSANASAVLKIGTLTHNGKAPLALHGSGDGSGGSSPTIFIGAGGINIAPDKTGYYEVRSDIHKTTLRPWNSDFTFGRGANSDYDFLVGVVENRGSIKFTLHTDDEAGVPRTITMDARIKTTKDTSSITVAGHGTNIVTSASPLMTGTYAVTDSATLVLKNGASLANGTVDAGQGTTLAVGESGTANVGNLSLADGASLAFNFTDKSIVPLLSVANGVTASGAVNVKISSGLGAEDKPKSGARVLTSGGGFAGKTVALDETGSPGWALGVSVNSDGNIVLNIRSDALTLIIK